MDRRVEILLRLGGIVLAFLATALAVFILGYDPLLVYRQIFTGALGSAFRIGATLNKAIPLVILSLGVSVAFKMKFWNIGGEGQMLMGGFGASCVALQFGHLPSYVLLPLMFAAGAAGGAMWAAVPALLKIRFGASETLLTLMLNYIALKWIVYLQYGPWRQPGGFPKIPNFSANAVLPHVFGIHAGWIIALVLAGLVFVFQSRSKLGYKIAVIGENAATASYAGINVAKVTVGAMLISGAICGAAGMIQCSAVEKTLNEAFTGGLGFTAVITAWLARLSPGGILVSSFAFALFIQGSSFLETSLRISSNVSGVLQGVLIFFVLGFEFFLRYKPGFRSRKSAGGPADA